VSAGTEKEGERRGAAKRGDLLVPGDGERALSAARGGKERGRVFSLEKREKKVR